MIVRLIARLLSFSPRLKQTLWTLWYQFVSRRYRRAEWTFMNFGYAALGATPETLPLAERDEPDRYPIQLYHHLAKSHIKQQMAVLEVGSGRGGGCAWLARHFQPAVVVGIDVSTSAVAFSVRTHPPNLIFRQGEAEQLPCENGRFDVVLNVESSHCYVSMERFLAEAFRVLKPGGHLLWADLCAADSLRKTGQQFENAGFTAIHQEDITPNVLRALDLDGERRNHMIKRYVPSLLRSWFRDFAGVQGTRLYESMRSRETRYQHAILHKPPI